MSEKAVLTKALNQAQTAYDFAMAQRNEYKRAPKWLKDEIVTLRARLEDLERRLSELKEATDADAV